MTDDGRQHHRRRSITTESITVNSQRELRFSGNGFSDETLSYTCLTVLNWPVSQWVKQLVKSVNVRLNVRTHQAR